MTQTEANGNWLEAQGLGLGSQVVDHEALGKAGVEVELKKIRKDLTLEKLVGLPVADGAKLAAGGGK